VKLLTKEELAEMVGVPPRTTDAWAYSGTGPKYVKVGRHRRYVEADVLAWLASKTRGGEAA
jgi:excisionase family DNA binding protein